MFHEQYQVYVVDINTLTAEIESRIQGVKTIWCRRLLNISYEDHVMQVKDDDLLDMVKSAETQMVWSRTCASKIVL